MKLIVGLGNPGEKYAGNRHNAGFMALELFARRAGILFPEEEKFEAKIAKTGEYILAEPQTYMNDSGRSVATIANFFKIPAKDIYIFYDDLDIKLGSYKLTFESGPKVHNGVNSVRTALGTNAFWHGRIGMENREIKGNKGVPGVKYSLQDMNDEELQAFTGAIDGVVEEVRAQLGLRA